MNKDILYPLRRLHGILHEQRLWIQEHFALKKELKRKFLQQPDAIFLIFTPTHTNMGDHAIAWAETQMLQKAGIPYIELTGSEIFKMQSHHFLHMMNGRPIIFNGGGYLGTLWFNVEIATRKIIENNPNSPIAILPNTIYYEDSDWGREELEKSVRIYNAHPNLTIFAREKVSYEKMKTLYKNVYLMPDMVLSLDEYKEDAKRKGCMICLRRVCEKTRTEEQEVQILDQVRELFGEAVRFSDMCIDHNVPPESRRMALDDKFEEFRSAELVVTDRLHAMIFSAITGTPCIVVDSKSPKVRGCYEWIRHLDHIKFADSMSQIAEIYRSMCLAVKFDNSGLEKDYQELVELIQAIRKKVV